MVVEKKMVNVFCFLFHSCFEELMLMSNKSVSCKAFSIVILNLYL